MTLFGQAVVGPPGSGKTTYCHGMASYVRTLGRDAAIINLDPANYKIPYKPDINVTDLIDLQEVMTRLELGPNGGLIYCMEYLEKNVDWLIEKIDALGPKKYLLLDFPGQAELNTHSSAVHNVLKALEKHDCRITAVHLVDAHHCSDAAKFISVVLLSLMTMIKLELPHVNVLSKIDLVESYGRLSFGLDFYTEVTDLRYLLPLIAPDTKQTGEDEGGGKEDVDMEKEVEGSKPSNFAEKYRKLNEQMCEVIHDFSLVDFETINIQDPESVGRVLALVDKCNGYVLGVYEDANIDEAYFQNLFHIAFSARDSVSRDYVRDVQEKYVNSRERDDGDDKLA